MNHEAVLRRAAVRRARDEVREFAVFVLAAIGWACLWFSDPSRDEWGFLVGFVALVVLAPVPWILLVERRLPRPFGPPVGTALSHAANVAATLAFFAALALGPLAFPRQIDSVRLPPNVGCTVVLALLLASWALVLVHAVQERRGKVALRQSVSVSWIRPARPGSR